MDSAIDTEKLIEYACSVFGNKEKALQWLNTPVRTLNNQKPSDFFYTTEGLQTVNDLLGRIEHGVYS